MESHQPEGAHVGEGGADSLKICLLTEPQGLRFLAFV